MKNILFFSLFVFSCGSVENISSKPKLKTVQENNIEVHNKPIEFRFHENAIRWFELDDTLKYQHLVRMLKLSDGGLKFTVDIQGKTEEEIMYDISSQLVQIKNCVDKDVLYYLAEFQSDIDMGSVIITCMIKNHLFD